MSNEAAPASSLTDKEREAIAQMPYEEARDKLIQAVQALEAGGAIRFEAVQEGAVARFSVIDNGRGIDPALQTRLFEPFFTTRSDGTGLGLAIARGVARAHGGDIGIQSEPGHGTTFTLTLAMGA